MKVCKTCKLSDLLENALHFGFGIISPEDMEVSYTYLTESERVTIMSVARMLGMSEAEEEVTINLGRVAKCHYNKLPISYDMALPNTIACRPLTTMDMERDFVGMFALLRGLIVYGDRLPEEAVIETPRRYFKFTLPPKAYRVNDSGSRMSIVELPYVIITPLLGEHDPYALKIKLGPEKDYWVRPYGIAFEKVSG